MFTGRNIIKTQSSHPTSKRLHSGNQRPRYYSSRNNGTGLVSRFVTFFAKAYNGSNNCGISDHYNGPSYRVTFIQDNLTEIKKFIETGGLRNNCNGRKIENYSVKLYVDLNWPSPMFGGCHTLHDAVTYANHNYINDDCIIYLIAATQSGEERRKVFANISYYIHTGESNPRAHENEIIHLGDFSDLVHAAITLGDARRLLNEDRSVKDEVITCRLTGQSLNISTWHKEQLELASKAESSSKLTRE